MMVQAVRADGITTLRERLGALPAREPERVSRKAAIVAMRDEVLAAQAKGYSLDEVLRILVETDVAFQGLAISTLRTYLRADREKAAVRTSNRNIGKSKSAARSKAPRPFASAPTEVAPEAKGSGPRTTAGLREDV